MIEKRIFEVTQVGEKQENGTRSVKFESVGELGEGFFAPRRKLWVKTKRQAPKIGTRYLIEVKDTFVVEYHDDKDNKDKAVTYIIDGTIEKA